MKLKKCNYYIEENDYYRVFDNQKINSFIIDKEDKQLIEKYYWSKSHNGYWISSSNYSNNHCCIRLHRLLLGAKHGEYVDHKDRDRSNNRRNNLRLATKQENNINRTKQNNNKSGFVGVYWDKQTSMWRAQIKINNKIITLGRYNNITDAVITRLQAELEYFGIDFAPQRHLFEQYNIVVNKGVDKINE